MKELAYTIYLKDKAQLSPDSYLLKFSSPELAGQFQPGQFLEVDCGGYIFRPFGLMAQDPDQGEICLGVKVVGPRSLYLTQLSLGQAVKVHAPLGQGFRLDGYEELIAVGGGSGIFPLYELLHACKQQGIQTYLICGFRSEREAYPRELFAPLESEVYFSSDQGGLDFTGHAGACLENFATGRSFSSKTLLAACGPMPLLKFVRDFARKKQVDCQLSLEENMACGLGLCAGCSVDVRAENGDIARVRCCLEGPVFDGRRLVFPTD